MKGFAVQCFAVSGDINGCMTNCWEHYRIYGAVFWG